jgi:hypothetical protein
MLVPAIVLHECGRAMARRQQRRVHCHGLGPRTARKPAAELDAAADTVANADHYYRSGWPNPGLDVFTSVSSNGLANPIIWALGRPVASGASSSTMLYAFDANDDGTARPALLSLAAGMWPSVGGNANLVPVVANGRVYVGSYQQLAILGIADAAGAPAAAGLIAPPASTALVAAPTAIPQTSALASTLPPAEHELYGVGEGINGQQFTLKTRTGTLVQVDGRAALKAHLSVALVDGGALLVRGSYNAAGVLVAQSVAHAKTSPALWGPDS